MGPRTWATSIPAQEIDVDQYWETEKLPQHVSTQVKRWGKFKVPDLLDEESWRINFPLAAPLNYQVEVHHHNILKVKEDDFQKVDEVYRSLI